MFVDADTHVDECDETWAYMPKELRPTTIYLEEEEIPPWMVRGHGSSSSFSRFWFMDGQLHSRRTRDDGRTGTTLETRELYDVKACLRDMDTLGVQVQVIYPTVLLNELTRRPELEVALCSSYNRWLANRCEESGDRLRWVALLPFSSIPDCLDEMKHAKDHGAVGIFKRGVDWERAASDPYFFPLYQRAVELDLPICIHSSLPWAAIDAHFSRVRPYYSLGFGGVTVLQAFFALHQDGVPSQFPGLRVGLIEAGSGWLPYLLSTVQFGGDRRRFLRDEGMFVTCEAAEDLAYIVRQLGDEAFMVGTDYTHGDRASVMYAHQKVSDALGFEPDAAERITRSNSLDFYGLSL